MNIPAIKKTLTRIYRVSFALACLTIFATLVITFVGARQGYIDAAEYPVDGTIALIVAFIFVAAGSRVARDLLPTPKDSQ
ncbi:hypothetical protein SJ279_25625 [Citrobacter freundii]|jgi:hypothetical protein|uniref:hypothetical protein n=1 Tax=Citrobacter freundii TaxID=546 RepID=UPI0029DBEEC1|nr:hypothetical protein [Citrobacter freundii]MDX7080672.1 hypothetical protein [Citrobacter freundii]